MSLEPIRNPTPELQRILDDLALMIEEHVGHDVLVGDTIRAIAQAGPHGPEVLVTHWHDGAVIGQESLPGDGLAPDCVQRLLDSARD